MKDIKTFSLRLQLNSRYAFVPLTFALFNFNKGASSNTHSVRDALLTSKGEANFISGKSLKWQKENCEGESERHKSSFSFSTRLVVHRRTISAAFIKSRSINYVKLDWPQSHEMMMTTLAARAHLAMKYESL